MVAGFVVLCGANIVGNIISAEKRCNYPGRSRVTRLVIHMLNCKKHKPKKMVTFFTFGVGDTLMHIQKCTINHIFDNLVAKGQIFIDGVRSLIMCRGGIHLFHCSHELNVQS